MRSPFIAALLWILCWSNCSLLHAQIRAFQHLDLSMENAPKGAVTCFQQDHQGFLWLGSSDGLFRYDGKAFQAFYHDPFDSTTLSNNFIKDIIEDRQGRLWVATRYGLNCYLPDRSVFVRYLQKESPHLELVNIVNSVLEDRPGKIWFSTLYGLFQMDVESGEQLHFLPEEENNYSIPHRSIWNLFEDQSGALWMGSNNGLVRYANDGSFRFECFLPDASTTTGLKTERVFNFYEQTNGILWMGTDQGLYRVNPTTLPLQFTELNHQAGMANSLSHRFVSALGGQGDEYLWAGTYAGGFNEIRLPQGPEDFLHFTHHRYQQNNPNSISSDKIESVFQDRTGVLWVSANVGVDFATPTTNKFDNVSPSLDDPTSLQGQVVTAMHRDKEGNLWVGTRKGLNFLTAENLAKGNFAFEFFQHQADDPRSISHSQISSIAEDSLGYVWIGTYRGLNYVHPKTFRQNRHFQYFDLRESGLSSNYIIAIHEIQKNEYWVGTFEGLNHVRFDPTLGGAPQIESFYQDDKLTKALGNSCITSLGKDRFGQYWVGTRGGLSKVIKQAGQYAFENYQYQPADKTSLRSNSVKALLLDRAGRLWVGTRGGLHLMVQESATSRVHFQSFGRKEGLSHEIIKAIVEDEQGQLWIPTNNGLFVFDPEQALADGPGIIKHYLVSDGLISASLNHQTIDADGNMYISGDNGFSYFHPARILENKHIPPVVFTELKILNKVVQPSSAAESILPKTINLTERIQLNYRQNAFSLKFAALDYSNPKKNQYAHQLVGFDPHWLYTGNDNTATYTNLPPGTYQLLAKGSNNDGIWNETPTRLTIEVLPPPWKTGWAYLIYVLLFGGLLSTFLRFRIRQRVRKIEQAAQIERARFQERATLRKQNAADFHDELGHRLTRISLFMELAQREVQTQGSLSTYFNKIKTNTAALSDGIKDLIWSLDPQKDSLGQTLLRLQEFGDQLFAHTAIKFKSEGWSADLEALQLQPDIRKHLLLIFKEAMNNSLKYAQAKEVVLGVRQTTGHYQIYLQDDGIGFDPQVPGSGYGLNNMRDRAAKISGTLSIESKPGKGTQIVLERGK